jgi:hypothetical protein
MNWLANAIRAFFPNCRDAVRLQSDALDRRLPWVQRVGLRIHLWLCLRCLRYGKQIRFLRTVSRRCQNDHVDPSGPALPEDARERIKRALKSSQK